MFDRNVFAISYIYSILITTTFTIIVNIVTHFNLKKILQEGTIAAKKQAEETMKKVRASMKLDYLDK